MSFNLFRKLLGLRKPLVTRENLHDYVEVICWKNPWLLTGHHLGLRIIREGEEVAYLSFVPVDWPSAVKMPWRAPAEAFFIDYQDDLLYQGFRNSWPEYADVLTPEQKLLLQENSIKRVNDRDGLQIAKLFPEEIQHELRKRNHSDVVILRSLDLDCMTREIESYINKETPLSWTFWGKASLFGHAKVHNCGSIVLDILYKGGLRNLLISTQDLMGFAGLLIGAGYAFQFDSEWSGALIETAVGFFAGRCLGGMYEGFTGIQSFLNLLNAERRDNILSTLGLRLTSVMLSGLIATVKPGALVPAVLVTPRDVMNLVNQALQEEEAIYSHAIPKEAVPRELTYRYISPL